MGTTWQQLNPSMVDETVDLEGCSYLVRPEQLASH